MNTATAEQSRDYLSVTSITPFEIETKHEEYAHSLSTIKKLGQVALAGEASPIHEADLYELAFADFITGVSEMLKTDEEHGNTLDINKTREHPIIDGKVCAQDGRPMVDILKDGAKSSEILALFNPAYEGQHSRDADGDVLIAERVDKLQPGETLIAVSSDPIEDIEAHPEIYEDILGYKKGLMYFQTYTKVDEQTLVAGSLSVEITQRDKFKKLLLENGFDIPEGASANDWIKHYRVDRLSPDEVHDVVKQLRQLQYTVEGKDQNTQDITEYVEGNEPTVRQIFDAYYPGLGIAGVTGENQDSLKTFAKQLLLEDIDLKPEVRRELIKIASSSKIDDESVKVLDSVIRYAAAEELRRGLSHIYEIEIHNAPQSDSLQDIEYFGAVKFNPLEISRLLAGNVRTGIEEGRSYGGCPGNIELGNKRDKLESNGSNLQEAFAGTDGDEEKNNDKDCEFISKECPMCGEKNVKTKVTKHKITGSCGCSVKK